MGTLATLFISVQFEVSADIVTSGAAARRVPSKQRIVHDRGIGFR